MWGMYWDQLPGHTRVGEMPHGFPLEMHIPGSQPQGIWCHRSAVGPRNSHFSRSTSSDNYHRVLDFF